MKCTILMGSPRKQGNTAALLDIFRQTLAENRIEAPLFWLEDKDIKGCTACRACQTDWNGFGCAIRDDMWEIFPEVLSADIIVLATPIYSWSCPAHMKALLDRLVYGMNKYYGERKGPSLWAGKQLALLVTCGYPPERGADLFAESIKRYCKHSALEYIGMLAERHRNYRETFLDSGKIQRARAFAREIINRG